MDEKSMTGNVTAMYAKIDIPLKIKPVATLGDIQTESIGEPEISYSKCKYNKEENTIELVITQTLRIKVPVEYGTEAEQGQAEIDM